MSSTDIGFQSRRALLLARLSALGFLGALGFVPGWHKLLGLSGFFGFLGTAFITEGVHRYLLWRSEKKQRQSR